MNRVLISISLFYSFHSLGVSLGEGGVSAPQSTWENNPNQVTAPQSQPTDAGFSPMGTDGSPSPMDTGGRFMPMNAGALSPGGPNCAAVHRDINLWCQQQSFAGGACSSRGVSAAAMSIQACSYDECLSKAQSVADHCQRSQSTNRTNEESASLPRSGPIPGLRPMGGQTGSNKSGNNSGGNSEDSNSENQSGNSSAGDYSATALANEMIACQSGLQEAFKCCNNPAACGVATGVSTYTTPPTNDPEGMKAYCQQMQYASTSGRNTNAEAAGVCFTKRNSCNISCSDSKKKWEAYLPQCQAPNCDPGNVRQALGFFNSRTSDCGKLEQQERLMANQSSSNYQDAQAAQQCAQQASQDQASQDQAAQMANAAQQAQQDSANMADSGGVDCAQYPNSPTCYQQQYQNAGAYNPDQGSVATENGSGISVTDFNTDSGSDGLDQFPQFASVDPQAAQGKAIPNGGGGMPGGGSAAAGSGFENSAAGGGAESGYKTDVLDGVTGGGGSTGSGDSSSISGGGGFGGYGAGGTEEFKNRYQGIDLKQYLPGGAKDPKRNVASAASTGTGHQDIIPMGESMFKRISNRMALMCKLKQLMGCE